MTVKEFKEVLADIPDDTEVYFNAYSIGRNDVMSTHYYPEDNAFEIF
jgi:hypothetical protein